MELCTRLCLRQHIQFIICSLALLRDSLEGPNFFFFSETKPYAVSEEIKRKRLLARFFFGGGLHYILFSFRREKQTKFVGALKSFVIFAGIIIAFL